MDSTLSKEKPVVRLRAFRAIDDPEACALFVEGHTHVLTNFGIQKITSARHGWLTNPAAFVLIVESLDKKKVYGGARIHVAGGSEPLPIEQATGAMDPTIHSLVRKYALHGTGEGCGLWNSREIAGYGIGSIFLTRAAISLAPQIGIKSLFALCAPYTVKLTETVGYRLETRVGNNGTFYYPKLDLIATTMIYEDMDGLSTASEEDRNAMMELRKNLNIVRTEVLRKKEIEIHYELEIPNLDKWSLADTIANSQKIHPVTIDENNLNIL
ncbi:hypothetical protein [Arcticibacter tournemirensis]|uniref:GNAT family N-acetyltransferase n=1 Tax=Arcticibacter tournemirensis TaxID=699437 RepID=A0A4Q0MFM7_9SPHI|nr:hypothetical protein [Arcticibacter tournemirensis]RXF71706.1 hypothetical protein EKH83_03195 [Arcticibacter tournemirensis]